MMSTFLPLFIPGVYLIEPEIFRDHRGFFMETYKEMEFLSAWINARFMQDNHSRSLKGVLRGLHFQTKKPQARFVRVVRGSAIDIMVDLRKNSPTYGKFVSELLSEENRRGIFAPKGFAHGFLALEDNTEFIYKCDEYHNPESDTWIAWDDPSLDIPWKQYFEEYSIVEPLLSEKDTKLPTFEEFALNNPF